MFELAPTLSQFEFPATTIVVDDPELVVLPLPLTVMLSATPPVVVSLLPLIHSVA